MRAHRSGRSFSRASDPSPDDETGASSCDRNAAALRRDPGRHPRRGARNIISAHPMCRQATTIATAAGSARTADAGRRPWRILVHSDPTFMVMEQSHRGASSSRSVTAPKYQPARLLDPRMLRACAPEALRNAERRTSKYDIIAVDSALDRRIRRSRRARPPRYLPRKPIGSNPPDFQHGGAGGDGGALGRKALRRTEARPRRNLLF